MTESVVLETGVKAEINSSTIFGQDNLKLVVNIINYR